MEILLDTTVQIERLFKRAKKEKIEKMLSEHRCGSSTYVFGEYKSNIIKDFVTLYNIICMEETLAGVRENINDTVFGRSFQRIYYIYNDVCTMYDDNYELVKEHMARYAKLLESRFRYGIEEELLNETDCHRAKAKIQFSDGRAELNGVRCTAKDDFCKSCEFFQKHKTEIENIRNEKSLQPKMKDAIDDILNDDKELKGNLCRTLGDCIICLEALNSKNKICTTNEKDFKPICDSIGVELYDMNS